MPWDFGGGGSPNPNPAEPHHHGFLSGIGRFFGSALMDVRATLGSLPQLPSTVLSETNRALSFVGLGAEPHAKRFLAARIPGEAAGAEQHRGPATLPEWMSDVHKKGIFQGLLDLPFARFVPGSYALQGLTQGHPKGIGQQLGNLGHQFATHPVLSALDIAPYASEGTHLLTKGTPLAEEAATHAAEEGLAGKAAKIGKKGLTPPQAAGAIGRRVGRNVEGRFPKVHDMRNSLASHGLGGVTMHRTMREMGVAKASFNAHLNQVLTRLAGKDTELGLKPEDVERVTHQGTFPDSPGWRDRLPANDRAYVDWLESEQKALRDEDPNAWFNFQGEDLLKSDHSTLWQTVNRINRRKAAMDIYKDRMLNTSDSEAIARAKQRLNYNLPKMDHDLKRANELFANKAPARFKPLLLENVVKPMERELLSTRVDPSNAAHVLELLNQDLWEEAGITPAERANIVDQANRHWTAFKNYDPMYSHHIAHEDVGKIAHPPLFDRITTPSSYKHLAWDMRPWIENGTVSVTAQWADWVRHEETMKFADSMRASGIVKTSTELDKEALYWAEKGAGKGKSLRERVDSLKGEYVRYDPKTLFPREGGVSGSKSDFYMPKQIAHALEDARPSSRGLAHTPFLRAPATAFRMSYLYFRPFYYVHVLLSGATMSLARGGPRDLLMLPKAIEMLRTGRVELDPRVFKALSDPVGEALGYGPAMDFQAVWNAAADDGEHLYHYTKNRDLESIQQRGLLPGKERPDEPTGVYFGKNGADLYSLVPRRNTADGVLLRAKRNVLPFEVTDQYAPLPGEPPMEGEFVVRGRIAPENLEYLNAENRWVPLQTETLPKELGLGYARMGSPEKSRFTAGGILGDELLKRYGGLGKTRAMARKVEHFTHTLASVTQDMWKVDSYLAEKARRTKGYTSEEATALAVEHANKVFGNMDELLPFERTVVRQILPFYAWSKHLLQYVSSFPFDHPWRASIVSGIGRAVQEDWAMQHNGLPLRFQEYLWLGQNKKGDEITFPASGLMPFMQVGNMLTMAGFLSRIDPRLKAFLESVGVDTSSGTPNPFLPQVQDPISGRQVSQPPNFFGLMAKDLIGQSAPLFIPDDLQQYYAKHPDKRREFLIRQLLGASTSTYNLQDEANKAAAAAQRVAAAQARAAAKSSPAGATGGPSGGWKF